MKVPTGKPAFSAAALILCHSSTERRRLITLCLLIFVCFKVSLKAPYRGGIRLTSQEQDR